MMGLADSSVIGLLRQKRTTCGLLDQPMPQWRLSSPVQLRYGWAVVSVSG
jgi:hypothetical protein